ncbi:NAD(+) diphosphatase [Marinicauda algicola]|uniref:NAD(+) diphosphatase n=1 Tax=Marinicauda algicola TaxID=2029849 RepID=A0A4S2GZC6_9PROT|nr:NAD(+) diphosphatase [Marinicauda algicola]TGY88443.1 NAD(+) diphosphatase [Marinicauda algicola]
MTDPRPLTFTRSPLDFSGLERADADWIAARREHPEARVLLLHKGDLATDSAGEPFVVRARETRDLPLDRPGLVFLGVWNGVPWFCAALKPGSVPDGVPFRLAAMKAEADFACLMGRARSLLSWHGRRKFCSNCGAENRPDPGGLKLDCPACGMEHFPRVDPSVIMLPHAGDRCVMGRQASWPPGMYATLAGFMEPGETIEEACARETKEEIGRTVLKAEYIESQPWPFPSSLMIGLIAEIDEGELFPDDDLEDARWFTREEVRALYESEMAKWAPPNFSISRRLIDTWLNRG